MKPNELEDNVSQVLERAKESFGIKTGWGTDKDLAKSLDVNIGTLHSWKSLGRIKPTQAAILAKCKSVWWDYVLKGENKPETAQGLIEPGGQVVQYPGNEPGARKEDLIKEIESLKKDRDEWREQAKALREKFDLGKKSRAA